MTCIEEDKVCCRSQAIYIYLKVITGDEGIVRMRPVQFFGWSS